MRNKPVTIFDGIETCQICSQKKKDARMRKFYDPFHNDWYEAIACDACYSQRVKEIGSQIK